MSIKARAAALILCALSVIGLYSCAKGSGSAGSALPDWAEAYEAELKKAIAGDVDPSCCFAVIYIDEDDVPELVVQPGAVQSAEAGLYTFSGGKAVKLGDFGEWGQISYTPKKNVFISDTSDGGAVTSTVFGIKDGRAVETRAFKETALSDGGSLLEIDGKEAGEDEYVAEFAKYTAADTAVAPSVGDAHTYPMTSDGVKTFAAAFGG